MLGELAAAVLVVTLIGLFAQHNPLMVIAMVGIAFSVRTFFFMWAVQKSDGVKISAALRQFAPIFAACAPMFAAVWGVRHGLVALGIERPAASLVLEVVAGAVVYVAMAFLLARGPAMDLLTLVRGALDRRRKRA
jgi:hypothetical protein